MTRDAAKSDASPTRASARLELLAVPGMPDFRPGDDLAALVVQGLRTASMTLQDGDVVVIAQKIVSKCEDAYATLGEIAPGPYAIELAQATGKDPRLIEIILADTSEVLRAREGLIIVANRAGHVMANAGVDSSNIEGGGERVLRLPHDPDCSALQLAAAFARLTGVNVGIVINDSWGRAWRNGTVGHAVGVAGFPALWDRRGEQDMYGRELRVTQIGIADEIAAAASLLMGAAGERQPVVIVRGLALPPGEGCARDLVRDKARDLFR
jgi:coenzyme F420-0:L-glutamate ligase/coenzyme F420-1:gamma-L-glutamate ligase